MGSRSFKSGLLLIKVFTVVVNSCCVKCTRPRSHAENMLKVPYRTLSELIYGPGDKSNSAGKLLCFDK